MSTTFLHGESGCACSRNTCKGCITYETYKTVKTPTTNADRIRAMTDEELAEYFAELETKCYLRFLPHWKCNTENFAKEWLEWLKQEVDNEAD